FYNPSQVSTCSHLSIIISKKTIEEGYIRGYFKHISEVREVPLETLDPFKNSISQHIHQKTQDEIFNWAEKQSYIVLANLMYAAAIENIDSCPMEGFRQDVIEEILN
ncbi:nitroreductase family protein, partial [Chryseobacterium indologenes]|uniref:nitroreductase family protein n=1 Tax=Chryseobacterium indologenes TaxID=253 RepID=UPI001E3EE1FD